MGTKPGPPDDNRSTVDAQEAAEPSPQLARIRELEASLDTSRSEIRGLHDALRTANSQLGHYREMFDFAPLPLLVLNRAGIIVQANLAAAWLLGTPRISLDGQALLGHVTGNSRGNLIEHLRLCRRGELPARAEIALRGPDDTAVAVEIHSHCRERDPDQLFTTLIDLTDRNRAEAERRRAAELEATAKAQDQFLSLVSHELRTPMAPIANLVEVLQMRTDLPDDLRPILATMERNVWMEVRLIDDLLDITRIRRGKLSIEKETLDLHEVLRTVESNQAAEFEQAGIRLVFALDAAASRIQADRTRMNQVFWNLLGNARKFTPAGGRVSVRTSNPAPGRIRIVVKDSGEGMAADDIARLFQPFEQVRDGYQKGLGLGLAIAKGIVDGHGGTLEAHSDGPDTGSSFSVTLPLDE
jgi:signal transduction histidine kinase